jgi:hypothetical protein
VGSNPTPSAKLEVGNMKIREYQPKALLAQFGIPIARGREASSPAEVKKTASKLGSGPLVEARLCAEGIGGVGGTNIANYLQEAVIVSYVADNTGTEGIRMRHAGAIITGSAGRVSEKMKALSGIGVTMARKQAGIGLTTEKALARTRMDNQPWVSHRPIADIRLAA